MMRMRFSGCGLKLEPLEARITPVAGYFRVVSYNVTAASGGGIPAPGLDVILKAIGDEQLNGVSQPIDVIALQEVDQQTTTSEAVKNTLNALYGIGTFARGNSNGNSTGSGTQGVVYNQTKLQLVSEVAIGTASTSGQPRQAIRYKFHPIGYPNAADFYIYNSHAKAQDDSTSEGRRLVEAQAIRTDADTLGSANIIYAGDWNIYRNTDDSFQHMTTFAGNGIAQDPVNKVGPWHANPAYKAYFTQAPALNPPGGLTGGGVDDRFDWQMITGELADSIGLDYVPSTYHTLAIDGSLDVNGSVTDAKNTTLPMAQFPNRADIFSKLTSVADHLPVVADYKFYVPPTVTNVTINGGDPQRSRVTQVAVTFSEPVTFPSGVAAAFQLTRQSDAANVVLSASPASGPATTVTLTFTGGAVNAGSLADGRYTLNVIANNVQSSVRKLDGNGDKLSGDNYVYAAAAAPLAPTGIYRIFGDSDGDGTVGLADFAALRAAFNAGPSVIFDFDNSANVDLGDFGQFRSRFNQSV